MKTEDCETWVATQTSPCCQQLARKAFQAGERHGIEKTGKNYESHKVKQKELSELGDWVHSNIEISGNDLIKYGATLLKPKFSSVEHRDTLLMCRALWDQVVILKAELLKEDLRGSVEDCRKFLSKSNDVDHIT